MIGACVCFAAASPAHLFGACAFRTGYSEKIFLSLIAFAKILAKGFGWQKISRWLTRYFESMDETAVLQSVEEATIGSQADVLAQSHVSTHPLPSGRSKSWTGCDPPFCVFLWLY